MIENGVIITMNDDRHILSDGAILVEDTTIEAIGQTDTIRSNHDADHVIDASNKVVFPGLITSHAHVAGILLRGGPATDRGHYDFLYNLKKPFAHAMTPDDHAIASTLYCTEALQSGITTILENGTGAGWGYTEEILEPKFEVYKRAGIRNIYGQSFIDKGLPEGTKQFVDIQVGKEPGVNHPKKQVQDTDEAIEHIESLIDQYHGSADGRQSIWPAPVSPRSTTVEGLIRSYELAEQHEIMTTTHASESPPDNDVVPGPLSMIEYLHDIDYLGERALIGHAVHLSDHDIMLLRQTDTKAAHNPLTNLALGAGFARLPAMLQRGVTVGLGTDTTAGSDTINMINDLRFAAMLHKGTAQLADVMTAETALEMATIDNARAIGRADELGSLEEGKKADMVLMDFDYPHLTPSPNVVSALVYQAQGFEVETVLCNGEVVLDNRRVPGFETDQSTLLDEASDRANDILDRAGLQHFKEPEWPVS